MSEPTLSATEVITWLETTSANWRKLLKAHPELLTQPCDVAGVKSVAELLQHIVAVELRYAERLADLPVSDYTKIPFDSVDAIYATHERSIAILRQLLTSNIDWNASIEYMTRSFGAARSGRRTILFHALLHGIRHYAQLATLVRQCGVKPDWPMDYIFMDIEKI
jgi:uncharacterized damage-inducible protein DinB